jgi:hypothetical protein
MTGRRTEEGLVGRPLATSGHAAFASATSLPTDASLDLSARTTAIRSSRWSFNSADVDGLLAPQPEIAPSAIMITALLRRSSAVSRTAFRGAGVVVSAHGRSDGL